MDSWVPDVLGFADYLWDSTELISAAASRLDSLGPFDPPSEVQVPKTPFFSRAAHVLSVIDRLAYHSVVLSFQNRIEQELLRGEKGTGRRVFSSRMSPNSNFFNQHGTRLWLSWQKEIQKRIEEGYRWGIKSDVAAYFSNVSHHLLLADAQRMNVDPNIVLALESMLGQWSVISGRGIPEGPDASRALANLYLVPVDEAMESGNWWYSRYMDDFRILAKTRSHAVEGIRLLEQECRKRGLILATNKTELLVGEEILHDVSDDRLARAQYWLNVGATHEAKNVLVSVLRESLEVEDNLDSRKARFSLWRLMDDRSPELTELVLSKIRNFAPLAKMFSQYLHERIEEQGVLDRVISYLEDPEQNTSAYFSAWILAATIRPQGRDLDVRLQEYCRSVAQNRNEPAFHRTIAINVLGQCSAAIDLNWIRSALRVEYDSSLARSQLVALRRGNAMDPGVVREARKRFPGVRSTLSYLNHVDRLPGPLDAL